MEHLPLILFLISILGAISSLIVFIIFIATKRKFIIPGILLLIFCGTFVLSIALKSNSNNYASSQDNVSYSDSSTTYNSSDTTSSSTYTTINREVKGTATDLGAGTFTGGKDIPTGLYEVTPANGQGNFTVKNSSGTLLINAVLGISGGIGVSKVRTQISDGDIIQLQGISKTHFEPVTGPYVNDVKKIKLYSGIFTVGADIAAGRYKATTPSGSGNFIIYDSDNLAKTNEILGGDQGVKDVTINLEVGDTISISSLNEVDMTPVK